MTAFANSSLPRIAICCDFAEENWPSMDIVADMLLDQLHVAYSGLLRAVRIRPRFRRCFGKLPAAASSRRARDIDRVLNRFVWYPRSLREAGSFDLYHVVDHSYSQLVHHLPPGRAVVTCHDLDTFACVLDGCHRRSRTFTAMTRRILSGLGKAAAIVCVSASTRRELLGHGIVEPARTTVIPNGVDRFCTPEPEPVADGAAEALRGPAGPADILHVGSTIPRKRIEFLLAVFAEIRRAVPEARLLRVGGPFTPGQEAVAHRLGIREAVTVLPFVERPVLAALYRGAKLTLQTSEAEGFGLPVIEAMACGTPVLASDIPVFREIGGAALVRRPLNETGLWTEAAIALLREPVRDPDRHRKRREALLAQASEFSWPSCAAQVVGLYRSILGF